MAHQDTFVLTQEYWDGLPFQFGVDEMTKVIGAKNIRYTQNHAKELSGVKLAGRWVFFKPNVAKLIGLEV